MMAKRVWITLLLLGCAAAVGCSDDDPLAVFDKVCCEQEPVNGVEIWTSMVPADRPGETCLPDVCEAGGLEPCCALINGVPADPRYCEDGAVSTSCDTFDAAQQLCLTSNAECAGIGDDAPCARTCDVYGTACARQQDCRDLCDTCSGGTCTVSGGMCSTNNDCNLTCSLSGSPCANSSACGSPTTCDLCGRPDTPTLFLSRIPENVCEGDCP